MKLRETLTRIFLFFSYLPGEDAAPRELVKALEHICYKDAAPLELDGMCCNNRHDIGPKVMDVAASYGKGQSHK